MTFLSCLHFIAENGHVSFALFPAFLKTEKLWDFSKFLFNFLFLRPVRDMDEMHVVKFNDFIISEKPLSFWHKSIANVFDSFVVFFCQKFYLSNLHALHHSCMSNSRCWIFTWKKSNSIWYLIWSWDLLLRWKLY